ncbi:glycerol-3-phosphate 1-O-acyltransferase PlsY [Lactobacillus mellis]|nr:glycerol-3-phosphate 1-O-acyltransferase PlsY [Bombilactobacillus mellis]
MKLIICFILAYLIGSIPSAYLLGKLCFHKDIRKLGSRNIGTTNTFRVFGFFPGTTVLLLDIFKGTLSASLPMFVGVAGKQWELVVGMAAVIGHCLPIFLHFQGGKAVATGSGILLAYNPLLFLVAAVMFATLVLITSTVSLASLVVMPIFTIITLLVKDYYLFAAAVLVTIIIYLRHLPNIKRLKNHQENMVHFGLVYYLNQKRHK